jgi:hypothetical protein
MALSRRQTPAYTGHPPKMQRSDTLATKQDIISGLEFLVRESNRIAEVLREDEWKRAKDSDGWENTQVLAHIASVGTIVVPFMSNMNNAAPDANAGAGLDINALNAQLVGARAGQTPQQLADETAKNYAAVIEFVKGTQDDFWQQPRTILGYQEVPIGDIFMRMVVLHGVSHIYEAYSAVMGPIPTPA